MVRRERRRYQMWTKPGISIAKEASTIQCKEEAFSSEYSRFQSYIADSAKSIKPRVQSRPAKCELNGLKAYLY